MRVIFRSRWLALAALIFLCLPLAIDAAHHLTGSEMHLPHSARLHRNRILAPIIFGAIAAAAFTALRFTRNRLEIVLCWAIALLFSYECVRYAWWFHTHHLLRGPYSWIFWVPAIVAMTARTAQLFRAPAN